MISVNEILEGYKRTGGMKTAKYEKIKTAIRAIGKAIYELIRKAQGLFAGYGKALPRSLRSAALDE